MAYDNVISRTDADALIPDEVSNDIITALPQQSAALQLFRNKNMGKKQTKMPVKSALPTAYFVNGDVGLKQTTEVNWENKFLIAEEIACIVPIPEAVLDDADIDVFGDIKPDIVEAFGLALDAAVFFGTNKPTSWPTAIVPAAVAASNTVTRGTSATNIGGLATDFSNLLGKVEGDGFPVTGAVTDLTEKAVLRNARDANGNRFDELSIDTIWGNQVKYAMSGLWPTSSGTAEAIVGDFRQGIIGIRQDITYKVLDQAVIQDADGNIVYNFGQQDMVGLRCVARFGFAVPNPINRANSNAATRYPFAVMLRP